MLVPILLTPLLTGCASTTFDARACPTERQYTKEEQARLADEYAKAGPALQGAMIDYGKLRDKSRACRSVK